MSGVYEIEGWTGFNYPARKGQYSKMEWHHYHFSGVDWDARNEKKAIFKIQGEGKSWAEAVDKEKGSFDYLMCVRTRAGNLAYSARLTSSLAGSPTLTTRTQKSSKT